ncbi:ATP-binding protein, partial [Escherichia coli]|nr:ATP-binding protein [Escherichia coli]
LLAWKRREIKNYLLSYTALTHHGFIEQINNGDLPANSYLKKNDPGDNSAIRRLNVKHCITKIIDSDGIGLDISKLYSYIELIPPAEISEDIVNMYNFLVEKLK